MQSFKEKERETECVRVREVKDLHQIERQREMEGRELRKPKLDNTKETHRPKRKNGTDTPDRESLETHLLSWRSPFVSFHKLKLLPSLDR